MTGSQDGAKFTWLAACLVSLYGLGSWIVVNGLWVELPLLVNILPEGWNLPAYLIIIIQIANVGPLVYVPLTKFCHSKTNRFCSHLLQPPERIANYVILTVGLLSCILLAQFWKEVIHIPSLGTGHHSIGLFILSLLASIVDCTSSVTFITYLNGMPQLYVGALHFGEAFSDLVPSVLALIQGVGPEPECINTTVNGTFHTVPFFPPPRFSISTFIYLLCTVLVLSLIAFLLLDCSPFGLGKAVHQHYKKNHVKVTSSDEDSSHLDKNKRITDSICENTESDGVVISSCGEGSTQLYNGVDVTNNSGPSTFLSCLLIGYISALSFGFLPAIQSYSCAAYSALTYHLAVTLSGSFSAISTVLTTFLVNHYSKRANLSTLLKYQSNSEAAYDGDCTKHEENDVNFHNEIVVISSESYMRSLHRKWIGVAFVSSLPAAYVIYLASSSPSPPFLGGFGSASAILAWIAVRCLFSSLRTWIWMSLSSHSNRPMKLRLAGLSTQFGAAFGAILSFLLVVYFQLFKNKIPCL
uniref:Riboflavin transporter n=2 Tax=Trichobilharzia regenti TaxID=157069 RepID=A0AA85J9Z6_TRIRE|nr:unnamed protein product [Trichobilharzia regenti]